MSRIWKLFALAATMLVATAAVATAGSPFPGTYSGASDDDEAVTVKVSGNGKEVTLFKVDQHDCGVTKLSKDVKVQDGSFTMKQKISGNVIFKVKGTFPEPGVAQGSYTQVACDGQKDTWNALNGI
jgi:hypothetical protein